MKREMKNMDNRELHYEKQTVARDQEILRLKNELDQGGIGLEGLKSGFEKKTYFFGYCKPS
jgi:hypothetical protein